MGPECFKGTSGNSHYRYTALTFLQKEKADATTGIFDLDDRFSKLNQRDKLLQLDELVDWELLRPVLQKARDTPRKSAAGRKPFAEVLMFKGLVLQHLYNSRA